MKKITYTKTADIGSDGEERGTYLVIAVDGIVLGTCATQHGMGRYGRETKFASLSSTVFYDRRKDLVNELICFHFNLIPADRLDGGIERTVGDFLAA